MIHLLFSIILFTDSKAARARTNTLPNITKGSLLARYREKKVQMKEDEEKIEQPKLAKT